MIIFTDQPSQNGETQKFDGKRERESVRDREIVRQAKYRKENECQKGRIPQRVRDSKEG